MHAHSGHMKTTSVFVMTSLLLAMNGGDEVSIGSSPSECSAVVEHENAKSIADFIHLASKLSAALDESYKLILSREGNEAVLDNHPFNTISSVLDEAVKRWLPLRNNGELGPEENLYLRIIAEARQKAIRNAHLVRQITAKPNVFESAIDRAGLIALSRHANQAHAALRS